MIDTEKEARVQRDEKEGKKGENRDGREGRLPGQLLLL